MEEGEKNGRKGRREGKRKEVGEWLLPCGLSRSHGVTDMDMGRSSEWRDLPSMITT